MAMKQVARVNALARSALNCMYVQFVRIRFLSDANTSPDKTPTRQVSIQHRLKVNTLRRLSVRVLIVTRNSGPDSTRSSHPRPRRPAQTIRRRRVPTPCARRESTDRAGAHHRYDPWRSAIVRGVQADAGEQRSRY